MKLSNAAVFCILLVSSICSAGTLPYMSPLPNSDRVSRETNIILRSLESVDSRSLTADQISVCGSVSGSHAGKFTVSDDHVTMLFQPDVPFAAGEAVTVTTGGGIRLVSGAAVRAVSFTFTVTPLKEPLNRFYRVTEDGDVVAASQSIGLPQSFAAPAYADSLPGDFPRFKVDTSTTPASGYYFLTTADDVPGVGHFLYMVDNAGKVVKYKRAPSHVYDFKVEANGLLSYADAYSDWGYAGGSRCVHRILDSTLTPVDSFRAGNGYESDTHEFKMLPNGHVLLHAYDIQYFDLSKIITGGNPNAIVVGSILQELDLEKNVVFQWRSWDHITIPETYMVATAAAFDYIHINAYDIDDDGNILACFRNTCEIVKINRMSGDMMWRMGGKNNQFTFIGEYEANKPAYYTFPHGFNRLVNGNFILFDNGNLHKTQVSRAVEYKVDQINKTATMIWEYHHTPEVFAPTRGSVQRLANGNTVIGWGSASFAGVGKTMITELSPGGATLFEMESLDNMPSYRAQKFLWNAYTVPAAAVTEYEVLPGNDYFFKKGDSINTGIRINIASAVSGYNSITVRKYGFAPMNMSFPDVAPMTKAQRIVISQTGITSFTGDVTFDSTLLSSSADFQKAVVYVREFEGQGMFFPLTTLYNAAQKTLTAATTKFGEFIIGIPDNISLPRTPVPVTPRMNERVNQTQPVIVRWNTAGHITGSHLQIATDSLFVSLILNDSLLSASSIRWNSYQPNTQYYWRAKAVNEIGKSGWSGTGVFTTSSAFITVTSPALEEKWTFGNQFTIAYDNNLPERVNIRLYRNGVLALKIKDSTENTGRYAWKIPATGIAADTTYSVRISSTLDSTIYAQSQRMIIASATGVSREIMTANRFALMQNYPNPFNPNTIFSYQLKNAGIVRLAVYDMLGREVAVLVNERREAGSYSESWNAAGFSSGAYVYRISIVDESGKGQFNETRRLMLVK